MTHILPCLPDAPLRHWIPGTAAVPRPVALLVLLPLAAAALACAALAVSAEKCTHHATHGLAAGVASGNGGGQRPPGKRVSEAPSSRPGDAGPEQE